MIMGRRRLNGACLSLNVNHSFLLTDTLGAISSHVLDKASVPYHQRLHHRHGAFTPPHSALLEEVRMPAVAGRVMPSRQEIRPGAGVSGVPVLRLCGGVDP